MKPESKLIILSVIILFISLIISTGTSWFLLFKSEKVKSEVLRNEEINKIRSNLKNCIDIGLGVIQNLYSESTTLAYQENVYGRSAKCMVMMVKQLIMSKIRLISEKKITLKEAQKQIIEETRHLRFNKGSDYIWIQTDKTPFPEMIMHPVNQELEGKTLDSPAFDCARNRAENLFVAAVHIASSNGGFLDYLWERKSGRGVRIPNVPKISYIEGIKEWGWVIGAGVFIDEAVNDGINRIKSCVGNLIFENGAGHFWIQDMKGRLLCYQGEEVASDSENLATQDFIKKSHEIIQKGKKEGSFVFQRTESSKTGPKNHLAYIKYFEPLGWILGSSANMASIDETITSENEKMQQLVFHIICISLTIFLSATIMTLRLKNYFSSTDKQSSDFTDDLGIDSTSSEKTDETSIHDSIKLLNENTNRQTEVLNDLKNYIREISKK
ncbi:MAG: cache domain-containing protein [Candidatus Riflebacteria bacterium]|nr:cache domain-containing protein [Candidatus Riflebacteria bacterium]